MGICLYKLEGRSIIEAESFIGGGRKDVWTAPR